MTFSVAVYGDNQLESDETFSVFVGIPNPIGGTTVIAEGVGTIRNDESAGTIHGQKFEDLNANGVHDPGELGLNGWTIQLVNAAGQVTQSTTTGDLDLNLDGSIDPQTERGLYGFNDLAAGTYTGAGSVAAGVDAKHAGGRQPHRARAWRFNSCTRSRTRTNSPPLMSVPTPS